MLPNWPSFPLLIMALLVLLCMAAMGALAVVLRRLEILLLRCEQRIDELGTRIKLIESRIDRSTEVPAPLSRARDRLLRSGPLESARTGGAASLRQDSSDRSEERSGQTLIAI